MAVLLLGFGDLDYHLGGRLYDVHLLEDCRPIIGDYDIAHAVDQHLIHSLWPKGTANTVGDRLCGGDILTLGTSTSGAGRSFLHDEYRRLASCVHCDSSGWSEGASLLNPA